MKKKEYEKLDPKEVERIKVGFYHRYMQQQLKKDRL